MADPRPLTRDQLAKFLPDAEAIKRFERLFAVAGDLTPTDVTTLYRLTQEASIDAGIADSKANEALASLTRIADSLDLLAKQPPPQKDTFLFGDYIDFPLSGPHVTQERRLQWNSDDGTLDMGLFNGVTLQVGQETHYFAKNTSAVTITNGSSVMATGTVGASGKLTIAKAVADGSVPAHYMIGIATQDISPNEFGYVTSFGLVRNINTTGAPYGETWSDGDLLYFNPTTAGGLTNVQPEAPELKTPQAIVVTAGTGNGSIFARMSVGMKLNDSDDVNAPAPAAGNILIYDATQNRWEAAHLTEGTNVIITNADGAVTIAVPGTPPTGLAGGVLSGSYPDPGFAVDMATQAELDAHTGDSSAHGVAGDVVGTTDTQTLSNKTLQSANLSGTTDLSGGQLKFPATQSASADPNTLDDYEEGTFTPVIFGTTTAGVGTYTSQVGLYTKIGNVVYYTINVAWSAHTGTGNIGLSGLPFTSRNSTGALWIASGFSNNLAMSASNILAPRVGSNSTQVIIAQTPVGGGAPNNIPMDSSVTTLGITGFYFV